MTDKLISLVVPVFNELEVIGEFHRRATAALRGLQGLGYEIIYVDDGSKDGSFETLSRFATADSAVRVVKFSRNFGHQVAITAGIDHARGDCIVVIDADLQDPPEVIAQLVEEWRAGSEVVYAVRGEREGEGPLKLLTAAAFYRLLSRIVKVEIPANVGDFRLMSRRAADHFRALREKDRFVRGLVSWLGFRQTGVEYHRDKRFAGVTKYPYSKMVRFALDGITSFSTVPLRLATWLGYLAALGAFLYLMSVFIQKLVGITVEGWATIMVAMLAMGAVQLICLGILGEYIGRIFTEIKARPMYIIDSVTEDGSTYSSAPGAAPAPPAGLTSSTPTVASSESRASSQQSVRD